MYNIIADLHTHTIASTHAYSTVAEMVTSAKNKGLYAIAITDHGKTMYGSPAEYYFDAMKFLPLMQDGVKVISGQETNIIDFSGTIDYNPNDEVNFVIASVHNIPIETLRNPSVEKCTYMYLNVAQNKHVNTIGHSGSELFKYDYEKVIPEFKKNNILVEINARSFVIRPENIKNCKRIASICKEVGAGIIISSDAHFHTEVANFCEPLKMLEEIKFPEELIINGNADRLDEYLSQHTNIINNRKF